VRNSLKSATTTTRGWLARITEPQFLFPALAVLSLGLIWGTTWSLIQWERAGAKRAAAASSRELVETYEAQVMRALREIDQTLKFVRYAYEVRGPQGVLPELKARTLLPPELLFVVSIADQNGDVVASTRAVGVKNVADQVYFQVQRETDSLSVGRPQKIT